MYLRQRRRDISKTLKLLFPQADVDVLNLPTAIQDLLRLVTRVAECLSEAGASTVTKVEVDHAVKLYVDDLGVAVGLHGVMLRDVRPVDYFSLDIPRLPLQDMLRLIEFVAGHVHGSDRKKYEVARSILTKLPDLYPNIILILPHISMCGISRRCRIVHQGPSIIIRADKHLPLSENVLARLTSLAPSICLVCNNYVSIMYIPDYVKLHLDLEKKGSVTVFIDSTFEGELTLIDNYDNKNMTIVMRKREKLTPQRRRLLDSLIDALREELLRQLG